MIARALIGHGPTGVVRRAAYASVLGEERVDWLTADANLADDVVVDLDDPDALPAALRDQLLASDALHRRRRSPARPPAPAGSCGLAGPAGRPGPGPDGGP